MSIPLPGHTFDTIFSEHRNQRIIVATFASNVDRVQQIIIIICFPLAMLVQWLERRSKERPRGVSLAELGLDNVEEA